VRSQPSALAIIPVSMDAAGKSRVTPIWSMATPPKETNGASSRKTSQRLSRLISNPFPAQRPRPRGSSLRDAGFVATKIEKMTGASVVLLFHRPGPAHGGVPSKLKLPAQSPVRPAYEMQLQDSEVAGPRIQLASE